MNKSRLLLVSMMAAGMLASPLALAQPPHDNPGHGGDHGQGPKHGKGPKGHDSRRDTAPRVLATRRTRPDIGARVIGCLPNTATVSMLSTTGAGIGSRRRRAVIRGSASAATI
jgi:hypothetical protein